MELKDFQRNALIALTAYLECARITNDPERAFIETLRKNAPDQPVPSYRTIPGLPGVPNVCIRFPTGGGKTLLAAHSIALAGRSYLERDYPVVLWLVPTNTIRTQTAEALKKTSHPYRAAIDAAYGGRVAVFDIGEVRQIRPQDLTDRVTIIVGTIQTLRVSNTEGRKVYAHAEDFELHFSRVAPNAPGLDRFEEWPNKGKIKFSFANLMYLHKPIVIIDEAHKAGTNLTFEMLAALRPSCVIEFTATPNNDPKTGSNVLFRASAAEVKAAEMIKLPIILTEHPDWRAAVHDAIETRAMLADTAKSDAGYIRPITLFQAENRDRETTVEVLKKHLIENENIAAERIAVATGAQRELDNVNLFDPACPVEFVITVEALKEGWDCSFAYVLCSVANISAATDIEQLLGRVLRMPYARRRENEALNRAYAHVSSPRFGEAARSLHDTLVEKMGFEPDEADMNLEVRQAALPGFPEGGLFAPRVPVLIETLDRAPDFSGLDSAITERVKVEERADGTVAVSVTGDIPEELEKRLVAATANTEKKEGLRAAVRRHRIAHSKSLSPYERGEQFAVPRLFLNVQGELQFPEEEVVLDLAGWNLIEWPAELSASEFSIRENAERFEVDIQGERVVYSHLDQSIQLELGLLKLDMTDLQLSRWLDGQCRDDFIGQAKRLEFCRKLVSYLMAAQKIPLNDLVRFKYQLAKAVKEKIAAHRRAAYAKGFQTFLFAPEAKVETSAADNFRFDNRPYPAASSYQGGYQFKKPFFVPVGELEAKGEEFDCAQVLDTLQEVKHWMRNLSGRPATSFWLPTSTDRFYPDFVAELNDGRVLVVEYKGGMLADSPDTKEKKNIGELWAEKSGGKCLFLMAEKKDQQGRDVRGQVRALMGGA